MKLNYISTPADLGGTAVSGCGTIHCTEISPTLIKLSDDLEMPFDFNDYILGSTGKREYSGDIDLVVDDAWWSYGISAFRQNLEETFGKENLSRHGNMLHLRYPIVGYNPNNKDALPRTGFVQIDFNFGNSEWEKFYHYVDGESAYKGAHRNLMIAAICSSTQLEDLEPGKVDGYNRPINSIRWKWGPNGLIRVQRRSVRDRDGVWTRKQKDEALTLPYTDPADIADILFPENGNIKDMYSMESLMEAVKRNYGMTDQERVWKRAANNFYDWPQGKLFRYPPEISEYFLQDDK